jgi:hypothetical protein
VSKNPNGGFSKKSTSREWGRKHRKEEEGLRGLRRKAKAEVINEQLPSYWDQRADETRDEWKTRTFIHHYSQETMP